MFLTGSRIYLGTKGTGYFMNDAIIGIQQQWASLAGEIQKLSMVQDDKHLLTVARYVERNPVTAGMVGRALE